MLRGYTEIHNLGHKDIADLLTSPVVVEEKIDGSQFSWGIDLEGNLLFRSKGRELSASEHDKMFDIAIKSVLKIKDRLVPGYIYRAEYLSKARHNRLKYTRVPVNNLIIFDISKENGEYLKVGDKFVAAEALGFETVPAIYVGNVSTKEFLEELFDRESILGGTKIEGVVIKNYSLINRYGSVLMGKYVSEEFKEVMKHKIPKPDQNDFIKTLVEQYATTARWEKAIQHLREEDKLLDSQEDIGPLMKEVSTDIYKECADEIKEELWKLAWPRIGKGCARGLADWYKNRLLKGQFKNE